MKKILLFILIVMWTSASADPEPLTFTKFIQLMEIKHKVEPGVHKIYLTKQQKETATKIHFPMFAPNNLCAMFDDLGGQTLRINAYGETEMVHTCDRKN